MGSRALRAAALGAGVAVLIFAISFVRALFTRAASSIEDVGLSSTVAGLTEGTIGALALLALTHSPAWPPARARIYAWLAAGATVLASGFLLPLVGALACAFVIAWLLADGLRELLPRERTLVSRAVLASMTVAFVAAGALLLALVVDRLGFAGEHDGMLGETALTTLLALVASVPLLRRMLRAKARAARDLQLPSDWTWGWLNDRNRGARALGYLYRDPAAGFCFHVLSDLVTAPSPAGLRASGYRGPRTLRLGQFEALHLGDRTPGVAASVKRRFEQGGAFGTVVMALTPHEQHGLGLPAAPPWAAALRSPPSQRPGER